jgi:hypothetical protein
VSVNAASRVGTVVQSHRAVTCVLQKQVTEQVVSSGRKMPCLLHDRMPLNVLVASVAGYVGVVYDTLVLSDVTRAFASAVDMRE